MKGESRLGLLSESMTLVDGDDVPSDFGSRGKHRPFGWKYLQHIQHMDGKATGWRFYEIRSEVQEHMGSFWR